MIDGNYLRSLAAFQQNPLHLVSREKLKELGQKPDQTKLAALQLAQHVLEKHPDLVPHPANQHLYALKDNLLQMEEVDPGLATLVLAGGQESQNPRLAGEVAGRELKGLSPQDAGVLLLVGTYNQLEQQLPALSHHDGIDLGDQ